MTGRHVAMALTLGAICMYHATTLAGAYVPPPSPPPRRSPVDPTFRAGRWFPGRRSIVSPPSDTRATVANPPAALTEADLNSCRKPAPGKHVVQVLLKPDTDVEHLIIWISAITCKAFVWSGDIAASRKRVTVAVPNLVTTKQAFRLFLDALNSVGLTVIPSGGFFQVIETVRAKTKPIPVYDWDGHPLTSTHR